MDREFNIDQEWLKDGKNLNATYVYRTVRPSESHETNQRTRGNIESNEGKEAREYQKQQLLLWST